MVDWKKEALDALVTEFLGVRKTYDPDIARAALDAAVKAQGCVLLYPLGLSHHEPSYIRGRAEAFEEAAEVLDARHAYYQQLALQCGIDTDSDYYHADQLAQEDAAAIRALANEPPK